MGTSKDFCRRILFDVTFFNAKMNAVLIFLAMVFLPSVLSGEKIKCWSHSKGESFPANDEFFKEGDHKKIDCDSGMCRKTAIHLSSAWTVTRGCGRSSDTVGCTGGGAKPRECFCKKALCNDAPSPFPPSFTRAATFLAVIVWKLVTRSF